MASSKIQTIRFLPLVIASILHSAASPAATIGPLAIRSDAVAQSFVAEAQLITSPGENPANMTVRLAGPDKFDEHGIAWHFDFSRLQFQTQNQADGSKLIRISSDSYWPQNHLDLVLEITSPSGSQFIKLGAELHRPSVEIARPRQTGFDPNALSKDHSSYGPIRATDTLWSIAKNIAHQRGVSTQVMLETLKKNNPDAFKNGSINALKSGVTLQISQPDTKLEPEKRPEPLQQASKPAPQETKALDLVAPVTAAETAQTTSPDNQTANPGSAPVPTGSGEGDYLFLQTRVETLEQQIGMMQQLLILKDQQLNQLQGNVEEQLEQQTQLLALSLVSSLLAAISMGLGLLLWRRKPQPSLSAPVQYQVEKSSRIQPPEAPRDSAAPAPAPAPVSVPSPEAEDAPEPLPVAEPELLPEVMTLEPISALTTEPTAIQNNQDFDSDHKDEFDFDFDLNPNIQRPLNNLNSTEDWTTEDNQESKIDLARAYFDMGDVEMAKEMAQQVLKDGNPELKNLARALIDEIAQQAN